MLKKKGFTLPEVVITIAIVGILSMVAVPVYRGYVNKSISSEGNALLAEISAAEQIYYARQGCFYATNNTERESRALGVNAQRNKYFSSYTITTSGNNSDPRYTVITKYNNDNSKALTLVGSLSEEPQITDNFSGK